MANNKDLQTAAKARKDEFYTQLTDIEKELRHYRRHFAGKIVFCNCDDPFESNFFKYFVLNFNRLGLKKLISTCYTGSPIAGQQLSLYDVPGASRSARNGGKPYMAEVTVVKDADGDGGVDMTDIALLFKNGENKLTELSGNGDFRSPECLALMDQSDIVVTNPPFSLLREYVAALMAHKKNFIILGNINAVTYKEFFPLIMNNQVWIGPSIHSGDRMFNVPDDYPLEAAGCGIDPETGRKFIRVKGVRWFTNLDVKQRHEEMILIRKYSPEAYPHYDNYDAIDVSATADIPCDYAGVMGVPITFLDKYCPDQFEILVLTSGRNEFDKRAWPTKRYENAIQINPNGTTSNGGKANTRATILLDRIPSGVYYKADNAESVFKIVYARILLRNKHPEAANGN